MENREEKIKQIILSVLNEDKVDPVGKIGNDDDLTKIGVNSATFIKTIVAIENAFQIEFPDEKLNLKLFLSFKDLLDEVTKIVDTK